MENTSKELFALKLLLKMTGGDIITPKSVTDAELESFEHIHSMEENDSVCNCLIELSTGSNSKGYLKEALATLAMQLLTITEIMDLSQFLHDHIKRTMDYLSQHPEALQGSPLDNLDDFIGSL